MTSDEKWRLWNAIDDFLNECLDAKDVDDIFYIYEKMKRRIWCPEGHDLIPDHCGMPHHDFCRFCGVTREALNKGE